MDDFIKRKYVLDMLDNATLVGNGEYAGYCTEDINIEGIQPENVVDAALFDRARTLLKATYELLNKQVESYYVLNILSETIFYDNAECDGSCLMEDIDMFFWDIDGKGLNDE